MHHKIWLYLSIIAVFGIGAILVYGNYQTSLLNKQGQIKGTQVEKENPSCGLSPSSGYPNTKFTISGSGFHVSNSEVTATWNGEILSTSSNTTDELGNFLTEASVPENAVAGSYKVEIQTIGLDLALFNYKDEFSWQNLLTKKVFAKTKTKQTTKKAHAFFNVTEPEPIPTEKSTPTTTPTPNETTTSITSIAPSPIESTTIQTTATTTTSTATQTTSAQPIVAPTSSNPRVSALPIIVNDDQGNSSITIDKDEAWADGEDKITIAIENEGDGVPEIEVSGEGNIVSEIKKEDNQFIATIKSTAPEEKTVKIKIASKELPEIKVSFIDNNSITKNTSITNQTPFYSNWVFWILTSALLALIIFWIVYCRNLRR